MPVESESVGAHEFIVGLGMADIGHGRLAPRERFVGVTTLFTADGDYYLSNLSKAVAADEYRKTLVKTLRSAISNVQTGMNWQRGDRLVLVFHSLFKRFSHLDVGAVKDLIAEFHDYDIRYALLEFHQQHPYLIFDTGQRGVPVFDSNAIKGEFAPTPGQYLQLTDREVLLCLRGPKQLKRPEDGMPRPIFIRLHNDSSFTDMRHLTEQVYAFSCHSWRSFLPASMPVTIQYSESHRPYPRQAVMSGPVEPGCHARPHWQDTMVPLNPAKYTEARAALRTRAIESCRGDLNSAFSGVAASGTQLAPTTCLYGVQRSQPRGSGPGFPGDSDSWACGRSRPLVRVANWKTRGVP